MSASVTPVRRTDRSRIVALGLACLGLADSAYLAYIKLTNQLASCSNLGDCETVNSSRYAQIGGVPIALLGAAGYLLILGAIALDRPGGSWVEAGRYAFFGLALVGSLYSLYLTYLEVFVLRAICPYCVASAVIMIGLFAISIARLQAPDD